MRRPLVEHPEAERDLSGRPARREDVKVGRVTGDQERAGRREFPVADLGVRFLDDFEPDADVGLVVARAADLHAVQPEFLHEILDRPGDPAERHLAFRDEFLRMAEDCDGAGARRAERGELLTDVGGGFLDVGAAGAREAQALQRRRDDFRVERAGVADAEFRAQALVEARQTEHRHRAGVVRLGAAEPGVEFLQRNLPVGRDAPASEPAVDALDYLQGGLVDLGLFLVEVL